MRRSSAFHASWAGSDAAYWARYYGPKTFRCAGQRAVVPEGAGARLGNVATTSCSESGHFVHASMPPRSQRACSSWGGARPTVDARSPLVPVGSRVACSRAHTHTCAGARVHGACWTYFSLAVAVAVAMAVTVTVAVGGWRLALLSHAYNIASCASAPEVEVVCELQGRDVMLERDRRRGGERDQRVRHAGVHHDQSHAGGHGRPRRAVRSVAHRHSPTQRARLICGATAVGALS